MVGKLMQFHEYCSVWRQREPKNRRIAGSSFLVDKYNFVLYFYFETCMLGAWCFGMGYLFKKSQKASAITYNETYFLSQYQLNGKRMLNAKHSDPECLYSKFEKKKKIGHPKDKKKEAITLLVSHHTFHTYIVRFSNHNDCFMWKCDRFFTL